LQITSQTTISTTEDKIPGRMRFDFFILFSPNTHLIEKVADMPGIIAKFLCCAHSQRTGPRNVNLNDLSNSPRAWRHHYYNISQEHCFRNTVSHKQNSTFSLQPDPL